MNEKKIRLRKYWTKNVLTYKEKFKTKEYIKGKTEYEVTFDNYSNMEKVLQLTGFDKFWNSSKLRLEYKLWNIVFDFDKLENIPWFVEIESNSEKDLIRWVELLWYSIEDTNIMTESQVKKHYWAI